MSVITTMRGRATGIGLGRRRVGLAAGAGGQRQARGQAECGPLHGPTDVETVATFSSCALVKLAVWRMSSEDAPTFTV